MITKVITYKKQGDGKDSWIIRYINEENKDVLLPEIVYEDPAVEKKVNIKNIDIDSIKLEDLIKLANKLKPYII